MHTKTIIAISVALGLCFLFIMALVTRVLLHKHSKATTEELHLGDGSGDHHYQFSHISSVWKRLFVTKRDYSKGKWVPTLLAIIKAGDEGFFSSTLLANLEARSGEISLQSLFEVFADELRLLPMSGRSSYPGELSRFLSTTRRPVNRPKRVQSMSRKTSTRGRTEPPTRLSRMSLDLSAAERGLTRGSSTRKPAPSLVPMERGLSGLEKQQNRQMSWKRDGQNAQSQHGTVAVKITREELAALSIFLGCQMTAGARIEHTSYEKGAFNISVMSSMMEDGKHQINLRQHKRSITQIPVSGSGYSSLFAKHLAAGSLPYTQDNQGVHTILVSGLTLKAVQSGLPMYLHDSNFTTRQLRYLSMLPHSRELNFHIASTTHEPQSSNPLIDAISALPFVGGLVPLSSIPLINTIQFIACGGLAPARLLQRLEGLVDRSNGQAPHLNLFGPLYEPQNLAVLFRERERLGRLATGTNVTDSMAHKASRMQRYITLLERLMALVPNMKPQEVLAAVRQATKKELEQSYLDAVAAHRTNASRSPSVVDSHGCPESDARSKRASTTSGHRSHRSSSASMLTFASPVSSGDVQTQTLAKQAEQILKAELPLSVAQIATVARLVLAAWTLSVEPVAWEDGEEGFRVPEIEKLPDKMVMC